MDKRYIWVLIETDASNLDENGKLDNLSKEDMTDILGNPRRYGIVDILDDDDIQVIPRETTQIYTDPANRYQSEFKGQS